MVEPYLGFYFALQESIERIPIIREGTHKLKVDRCGLVFYINRKTSFIRCYSGLDYYELVSFEDVKEQDFSKYEYGAGRLAAVQQVNLRISQARSQAS
jgi:hypothetical protein